MQRNLRNFGMAFWDTKFAIRGRIEELAALTRSSIIHTHDDFDKIQAIQPTNVPPGIENRFELFCYVHAPAEPLIHVLATDANRLQDLAILFVWLKLDPEDIACETDFSGKPHADIEQVRAMMREAKASAVRKQSVKH